MQEPVLGAGFIAVTKALIFLRFLPHEEIDGRLSGSHMLFIKRKSLSRMTVILSPQLAQVNPVLAIIISLVKHSTCQPYFLPTSLTDFLNSSAVKETSTFLRLNRRY